MFYQGGPTDHCTYFPGPVSQYSYESKYNSECTAGIALANSRVLNNEVFNKDQDVVPEQSPLITLDKDELYAWIIMLRTPNTPYIFTE